MYQRAASATFPANAGNSWRAVVNSLCGFRSDVNYVGRVVGDYICNGLIMILCHVSQSPTHFITI